MYKFKDLRLYTQVVNGIRFEQPVKEQPYVITYLSENSLFFEDYPKLNLVPFDVKIVVVPYTKIPKTKLTNELIKTYKNLSLLPIQSNLNVPQNKNVFFDLSQFLNALDYSYKPTNYRQRAGTFVLGSLFNSFSQFPNHKKVLLYSVDVSKPFNKNFVDRKILLKGLLTSTEYSKTF